jgi:hypothetical protein
MEEELILATQTFCPLNQFRTEKERSQQLAMLFIASIFEDKWVRHDKFWEEVLP